MLTPRLSVPTLEVATVAHGPFDLLKGQVERYTMVVFYRGLHCPICAKYLMELERLAAEFANRGVRVVAVSSDTADRARAMAEKIGATQLPVGYGLNLQAARDWGLYISESRGTTSIGIEEPPRFSEPGVFLVRPDGTLYYASVQTMPFARPAFRNLLAAIDFAVANEYPARGEYTGEL